MYHWPLTPFALKASEWAKRCGSVTRCSTSTQLQVKVIFAMLLWQKLSFWRTIVLMILTINLNFNSIFNRRMTMIQIGVRENMHYRIKEFRLHVTRILHSCGMKNKIFENIIFWKVVLQWFRELELVLCDLPLYREIKIPL